jgi:hypothetical protein
MPRRTHDVAHPRVPRRVALQAGAISLLGVGMNHVAGLRTLAGNVKSGRLDAGEASGRRPPGRAKSVILFNLLGGPSQLDMFDMKPTAPAEVRGEFTSIQTSLPGLRICEHMPKIARLMHKAALIRTITHGGQPIPGLT